MRNRATAASADKLSDFDAHEIQVSGNENFPADQWDQAFLYYLEGVRTNGEHVMYRPKIFMGSLTLRRGDTGYYAVGAAPDAVAPKLSNNLLICTNELSDVEGGLRRFTCDPKLQMLVIVFSGQSNLSIWKKKDGTYGCAGVGINPDRYA